MSTPARSPRDARRLAWRRGLGSLALCAGVLVTVSTPAPYFIRTEVPVAPDGAGATLRVREVLVLLPAPHTTIEPSSRSVRAVPWDGAPVLTLLNEGSQPVVFRSAGAGLSVEGCAYEVADPVECSLAPGECRSVPLTLRRSRPAPSGGSAPEDPISEGSFRFGELVFPDGTSHPIQGRLAGLSWSSQAPHPRDGE